MTTQTEKNILKEIESWEKVHYEKEELNDNRDLQLTKLYSKLEGYQLAQKENQEKIEKLKDKLQYIIPTEDELYFDEAFKEIFKKELKGEQKK